MHPRHDAPVLPAVSVLRARWPRSDSCSLRMICCCVSTLSLIQSIDRLTHPPTPNTAMPPPRERRRRRKKTGCRPLLPLLPVVALVVATLSPGAAAFAPALYTRHRSPLRLPALPGPRTVVPRRLQAQTQAASSADDPRHQYGKGDRPEPTKPMRAAAAMKAAGGKGSKGAYGLGRREAVGRTALLVALGA